MTILEARSWLNTWARNPGIYSDEDRDRAVQVLGNDFIFYTLWPRVTGDITLAADTAAITDFTAVAGDLSNFRPDRLLRAYFPDVPTGDRPWLDVSDFQRILEQRSLCPLAGVPTAIGFESSSSALLDAAPTQEMTLRFLWVPPFTNWEAGTADSDVLASEVNIPTDQLQEAITYGATAFLQFNEPESQYAVSSWQKYTAYRDAVASRGPGVGGGRTKLQPRFAPPPGPRFLRRY